MKIPLVDVAWQHRQVRQALDQAFDELLTDPTCDGSACCKALEADFVAYFGRTAAAPVYAVSVQSGRAAQFLILKALGIGPGAEVITVPNSDMATTAAISQTGASLVFVDVAAESHNLDPALLEAAITPRTRAIVPVHMYGLPAQMAAINIVAQRHQLLVIEDATLALGAEFQGKQVGLWGEAGFFAFAPRKVLGGIGNGGMVITKDRTLARQIGLLKGYGLPPERGEAPIAERHLYLGLANESEGYNLKLDGIQAAVVRAKFVHLDAWGALRQAVADRYRAGLAGVPGVKIPQVPAGTRHGWRNYTIAVPNRDRVQAHLRDNGITNVPDINTRATMLEAGDVDMAFDLAIQDVERLKSNAEFTVREEVGSRQWYITMNNVKAPLDDVKVRQAINHAVDKEGIIQAVYLGSYATIARAVYLMPTIDGYHDAGVYEYDVEKAAALLAEAGWVDGDGVREKDGEPLSINLYTRKGSAAGDIEIAELVQGMLTEVGINVEINTSRYHLMNAVEASLRRLQSDHIDLYYIHRWDNSVPIEETMRALDDLIRLGKIRYIGASDFASWQLARANLLAEVRGWTPCVVLQSEYHLLNRSVESEVLPYCQAHNVGFIPYFPLAGGFWTGKYKRGEAAPAGSRGESSEYVQKYMTDSTYNLIDQLTAWAAARERGLNELAQAWLMAQPQVCSVISGATNLDQLLSNVKAADWQLSAQDLAEINALIKLSQ